MSDIRYDAYGTTMGYSNREKPQGGYSGRSMTSGRYVGGAMGNGAQKRGGMQQNVGMGNTGGADRVPGYAGGDEVEAGYSYGMVQGNRGNMQGHPRFSGKAEVDMKGGKVPGNYRGNGSMGGPNYAQGGSQMVSNSPMEQTRDDRMRKAYYKVFAGALIGEVASVQPFQYVLPNSFHFASPSISPSQIHSFSNQLLLYIFYWNPRDVVQLYAAQELYSRDFVYHKVKQLWYHKEKQSANYAVVNCGQVFVIDSLSFNPCSEVFKITEVLSLNDLNEFIKKIPK